MAPALDDGSRQFYELARLIMTEEEAAVFVRLPDRASREVFVAKFWAARDPDPSTAENEFKAEFYRRVRFANFNFREGVPGWKSDRGRMYIALGQPDEVTEQLLLNSPEANSQVVWNYGDRLALTFIDKYGDGRFTLNDRSGVRGDLTAALRRAKSGAAGGALPEKRVDFVFRYFPERKQGLISLPVTSLVFKAERGRLIADFNFELLLQNLQTLQQRIFTGTRRFDKPEEEVRLLKYIDFVFPLPLEDGAFRLQVTVGVSPTEVKTSKTFSLKR